MCEKEVILRMTREAIQSSQALIINRIAQTPPFKLCHGEGRGWKWLCVIVKQTKKEGEKT